MAIGTNAGLLTGEEPTQSFFKHELLRRYLQPFVQKLGRMAEGVTLVDGYAGRGRYPDGSPASAAHLLMAAASAPAGSTEVELVEVDPTCWASLDLLAEEFGRRVQCVVSHGTVEQHLGGLLARARGRHALLFLDPCGAGLPFDTVVDLAKRAKYPRTELLMNFNGDLGRRVVAAALKRESDSVLDRVLGSWWRDVALQVRALEAKGSWERVLERLVNEYVARLSRLARVWVMAIPVRRNLTGQPVFYLIFTTHSPFGVWEMNDALAKTVQAWALEVGLRETGQSSLFDDDPDVVVTGHQQARERVRENALALARSRRHGRLVDLVGELLDDAMGVLTSTEIASVFKVLASEGLVRLSPDKKLERRRLLYD